MLVVINNVHESSCMKRLNNFTMCTYDSYALWPIKLIVLITWVGRPKVNPNAYGKAYFNMIAEHSYGPLI